MTNIFGIPQGSAQKFVQGVWDGRLEVYEEERTSLFDERVIDAFRLFMYWNSHASWAVLRVTLQKLQLESYRQWHPNMLEEPTEDKYVTKRSVFNYINRFRRVGTGSASQQCFIWRTLANYGDRLVLLTINPEMPTKASIMTQDAQKKHFE